MMTAVSIRAMLLSGVQNALMCLDKFTQKYRNIVSWSWVRIFAEAQLGRAAKHSHHGHGK